MAERKWKVIEYDRHTIVGHLTINLVWKDKWAQVYAGEDEPITFEVHEDENKLYVRRRHVYRVMKLPGFEP